MSSLVEIRRVAGGGIEQVFLTACPEPRCSASADTEARFRELFEAVAAALRRHGCRIFAERVFTTWQAVPALREARRLAYRELDDGVDASWVCSIHSPQSEVWGVSVHAVAPAAPAASTLLESKPVAVNGVTYGRRLRVGGTDWLALAGLCGTDGSDFVGQADAMYARAREVLSAQSTGFSSVCRTWLWLGDILACYEDFNRVRTRFLGEQGLISAVAPDALPASTGVGLWPTSPRTRCMMELLACSGTDDSMELLAAAGKQQSAFRYGSAFSRAALTRSALGTTLFVSGTAAVSAEGGSLYHDDASSQIRCTLDNVAAVLADCGASDEDIVSAVVYAKTPEILDLYLERHRRSWPSVNVICDICRPELLFEVEATACWQRLSR
jgi:enamine deaminase RidA (YjgF/YER057c/UK114 family)